jgi:type I restriction enzyme S subunit
MKQYESYKDSLVPSIGNVPESWKVVPIKYVLEQSADGIKIGPFGSTLTGKVYPDQTVKVYGQWNVIGKDFTAGKNFVSEETYQELESYWIHPNDILISMMGTVGKCAIIPVGVSKGIMDSHIVKVRLNETVIDPQFFNYVYDKDGSNVVMSQIQRERRGSIMDGLNSSLIKSFIIPLPPISEQRIIASFLDNKVSQIDVAIAEKEKMIEDLQNYRKSIISETVTRGLDPNVAMKDSGVEWIGMIPEDWGSVRLSRCAEKIGSGKTPSGGADVYTESGIMFIRSQNVYDEGLQLDGIVYIPEEIDEAMSSTRVLFDDVLLNITGGSIGRSCYISDNNIKANVNQHVCIIRTKKGKLNAKFLHLCLISEIVQNQIKNCQTGGNREELNFEQIGNFIIPYPDLTKQEEIASYLERKLVEISETYKFIQAQMEDLKAYKSSLITEAVTGKIDLRNE